MNSLAAFVVICLAVLGAVFGIKALTDQPQTAPVVISQPVKTQCQDGSIQEICPPVVQNPPPPDTSAQQADQSQQPMRIHKSNNRNQDDTADQQAASDNQYISPNQLPEQTDTTTNVQPSTCEEMVDQQLGGPGALGGDAAAWTKPDWSGGAWTYFGSAAELHYPGFGWFDTWPDHGGSHLTHDFMSPAGDASTAAASFHCS